MSNMYDDVQTWNPFMGCEFDCTYCEPTFKRQAKRQKQNCLKCYAYTPHFHEHTLKSLPSTSTIFVGGNGDLAFCEPSDIRRIIERVKQHSVRCPHKTFFFQSKQPEVFAPFLSELPESAILLTTLETNRDEGYGEVSKAPLPSVRYQQFFNLDYPRKVVTAEPLMDFDTDIFSRWIIDLQPEYVWVGLNSKAEAVKLPEPSDGKVSGLIRSFEDAGIRVKAKYLRGAVA